MDTTYMLILYEEKLKEYMSESEYKAFVNEVAQKAFAKYVDEMPEGEFKDFCKENFDKIIADDFERRLN